MTSNLTAPWRCLMLLSLGLLLSFPVHADSSSTTITATELNQRLDQLQVTGNGLLAELSRISLNPFNLTSQWNSLGGDVANYRQSVESLFELVEAASGTLSLDPQMLDSLQGLANISLSLAQGVAGLSSQLVTLASPATLGALLATTLRLSDDIGVMADRILEMAEKILVMADNIGLMADRILATQVIQNDNIALVTAATLETQKNALTLVGLFRL